MTPKNIFLLDGVGAILSGVMLGVVLPYFSEYVGLGRNVLYFLAAFPCVFLLYDIYCMLNVHLQHRKWIVGIAMANLVYAVISVVCLILYRNELTALGMFYFVTELIILIVLIFFELKYAKSLSK